jgi:hypothetical protein
VSCLCRQCMPYYVVKRTERTYFGIFTQIVWHPSESQIRPCEN